MTSQSAPASTQGGSPAVTITIGLVYLALGVAASILAGRDHPEILPEDAARELCPSIAVVSVFLTTYYLFDVMPAGMAKADCGYMSLNYDDFPLRLPERAFLAERAQANQVEQLPAFLFATMSFSLLVNGRLGAALALAWSGLRRLYARAYRNSVGVPYSKKGLSAYTLPCYFIVNTMLLGTAVHILRWFAAAS